MSKDHRNSHTLSRVQRACTYLHEVLCSCSVHRGLYFSIFMGFLPLSLSHFLTIYVLIIIVPDRPSSEGIGQDVLIYVLPIQAKQEQVGVWVCTSPMLLVFSKMIFLMMPLQLLICLGK